jgi:hypothetical protein
MKKILGGVMLVALLSSCYTTRTVVYPSKLTLEKCRVDNFPLTVSAALTQTDVSITLTNRTDNFISVERIQFLPSIFKETNTLNELILPPHGSVVTKVGNAPADGTLKEIQLSIRLSDNSYNTCDCVVGYDSTTVKVFDYANTYLATLGACVAIPLVIAVVASDSK